MSADDPERTTEPGRTTGSGRTGERDRSADDVPGPRRRRRATGGTAPHADPEPLLTDRAPDDRDEAWGDRGPDDDERHLREVPPHW